MAWSNAHDDAPRDDEGRPIHPEKGYPICGYAKTDATANNGRKREDVPYCLQTAGWGTDRSTGHCRNHYGGSTGAPEGWANGNARHLMYSKRMNEDDRSDFKKIVKTKDGDRIGVDEMAEMLENMIGFEYMRLSRAVDQIPDVELVEKFKCPNCRETHFEPEPDDMCGGDDRVAPGEIEPCRYSGEFDRVEAWVEFGDKQVERKEGRVANLMSTYKQIAEGTDVNISGDHRHTHEGGDNPVSVDIRHHMVELPDSAGDSDPDEDDDEDEEQ